MSQWNSGFQDVLNSLDADSLFAGEVNNFKQIFGLLHALILSWANEATTLLWITVTPGNNLFGSQVVFVNEKVIDELHWSFEEWENGTAVSGIFSPEDAAMMQAHLRLKSTAPILVRTRGKTTNPNQNGDLYQFHIHHNLPYGLRLTVATPALQGL